MMYHVKFTSAYKKSYKRARKRGWNLQLLDDVVEKLRLGKSSRKDTLTMSCVETGQVFVNVISSLIGF